MENIYFFSGLGADERVFRKLKINKFNPIHIPWLEPKINELLPSYILRITADIKEKNPIFIGLSFGGIVALEASKLFEVRKLILISSVKNENEVPYYFRWLRYIPLHKLIPSYYISNPNLISNWMFGVKTTEEKNLLKQIMNDTPISFFRWAMNIIIKWTNDSVPPNTFHIHGSSDKILPAKFVNANYLIKNGEHFTVFSEAEEVSEVLNRVLI